MPRALLGASQAPTLSAGCPQQGGRRSELDLGAWNARMGPWLGPTVHVGLWLGARALAPWLRPLPLEQRWTLSESCRPQPSAPLHMLDSLCTATWSAWAPGVDRPAGGGQDLLADASSASLSLRSSLREGVSVCPACCLGDPFWPLTGCLLWASRSIAWSPCLLGTHKGRGAHVSLAQREREVHVAPTMGRFHRGTSQKLPKASSAGGLVARGGRAGPGPV